MNAAIGTQDPVRSVARERAFERRAPARTVAISDCDTCRIELRQDIARVLHAGGFEEHLAQEGFVAPAGQFLDDHAEEAVAGVRILEVHARLGRQRRRHGQPHDVVAGHRVPVVLVGDVDDAGGVRQQMMQRDGSLVGGHAVDVLRERILHAQAPLFLQPENRGGGELLRDRADVRDGRIAPRRFLLAVGETDAAVDEKISAGLENEDAAESELPQTFDVAVDRCGTQAQRIGGGRRGSGRRVHDSREEARIQRGARRTWHGPFASAASAARQLLQL